MRGQDVYPEGKTVLAGSVYPEMFVTAVKLPTFTLSAGLHTAVETTTHRSATLTINNYQVHTRLVNLDVEDCSENELGHPKPPIRGSSLDLYGIRAPIIGPFRAWKPTNLMP